MVQLSAFTPSVQQKRLDTQQEEETRMQQPILLYLELLEFWLLIANLFPATVVMLNNQDTFLTQIYFTVMTPRWFIMTSLAALTAENEYGVALICYMYYVVSVKKKEKWV